MYLFRKRTKNSCKGKGKKLPRRKFVVHIVETKCIQTKTPEISEKMTGLARTRKFQKNMELFKKIFGEEWRILNPNGRKIKFSLAYEFGIHWTDVIQGNGRFRRPHERDWALWLYYIGGSKV